MTSASNVPLTISGDVWSGADDTGEHTMIDLHLDLRGTGDMLRDINNTLKPYEATDRATESEAQNLRDTGLTEDPTHREVLR